MNTKIRTILFVIGGVVFAANKLRASTKDESTIPPAPANAEDGTFALFNVIWVFALLSLTALAIWRLLLGREEDYNCYSAKNTKNSHSDMPDTFKINKKSSVKKDTLQVRTTNNTTRSIRNRSSSDSCS